MSVLYSAPYGSRFKCPVTCHPVALPNDDCFLHTVGGSVGVVLRKQFPPGEPAVRVKPVRAIEGVLLINLFIFRNINLKWKLLMDLLEYWAFEILVLVAGLLPDSEMNTSLISICENTECLAYMITYGFSAAVSTRVSNELGAGNERKAKVAVTITIKLAVMLACAISVLLLFGHNIWAAAFSDSWKIRQKFATIAPLLAASIFFDAIQGIISGVARGCGWQHLAAWTNLLGFYIIGMPIAIFLAFVLKLHSKGLWTGLLFGISSQTCILLFISFFMTNWTKMVQDAQGRLGGDAKEELPRTINP
ncbi:protein DETOXIFICATION 19-like [Cryptomeria japonica]|uniref:protein DETOXIFICATION 19-like n=1 Tax=Cryptomeria japonica TaxID=3369 RepID=UPI0027DA1185|nr:protein DETOXIFICATION 19-like [Cryptomeria japonica]